MLDRIFAFATKLNKKALKRPKEVQNCPENIQKLPKIVQNAVKPQPEASDIGRLIRYVFR
jgi:hypothetical protein